MQAEQTPAALSLHEVVTRCRAETARYRRDEEYDDRYCFEIFRRAISGRDEACWEALQSLYHDQVLAWCRRAGSPGADVDELMALAWEKFWRHYTAEKLAAASGSAAVLRYLKMCAQCSVIDTARGSDPTRPLDVTELDVPDKQPLPGDAQARRAAAAEFWNLVGGSLRDQRERILVHLTYEVGLKPAQIQAQRPDLFPTIKSVYQSTRYILDRLRRNVELRSWLERGEAG